MALKSEKIVQEQGISKNNDDVFKAVFGDKKYLRKFIIATLSFLVLYTFLYGFWTIPVIQFGINRLSPAVIIDYLFVGVIVFLSALFVTLFLYERERRLSSGFSSPSSLGGVGSGIAGFLAAVCPVCQSIAIVAFGSTILNIPLAFLIPYLGVLKIVSVGLLGLAIVVKADSIATGNCLACEFPATVKEKIPVETHHHGQK